MNKVFLFLLLGAGAFAAFSVSKKFGGLKRGPNHLHYKVINGNVKNAKVLKPSNMVAISLVQKMNDSFAVNSYETGHKEIVVDTANRQHFFFGGLLNGLKVGDSVFMKISVDSVLAVQRAMAKTNTPDFSETEFRKSIPPFFQTKGNVITLGVKILDCFVTDSTNADFKKDSTRFAEYRKKQADIGEAFAAKMEEKKNKEINTIAKKNNDEGEKFLVANKTKPGVVTTASGLQYQIIKKGTGAIPTAEQTVVVNYIGTLLNGNEFDNSYKTNKPAEFPVKGVIAGWGEVLQLMPKGSKYKAWIPAKLAYGNQENNVIPAGSTLAFEIELVDIK